MLVVVTLSSKFSPFPMETLSEIDSALASIGLKKQVRSVLVPGKEFSTTYDGSATDKAKIEGIIAPLAERRGVTLSVDFEEPISFP